MSDPVNLSSATPRYRWPWILAVLVIVGIILSVLGIRHEAQRVREQRQMQMPTPP
jgi:F0F1-type ATP synthase assembly protein I